MFDNKNTEKILDGFKEPTYKVPMKTPEVKCKECQFEDNKHSQGCSQYKPSPAPEVKEKIVATCLDCKSKFTQWISESTECPECEGYVAFDRDFIPAPIDGKKHAHAGISTGNCNICTPSSNSKVEEWEVEFDRKFQKQGIPRGVLKYQTASGVDVTIDHIKSFIKKVVSQARQEERERVTHYYKVTKTGKLGRQDMEKAFEAGRKKELTGIVEWCEGMKKRFKDTHMCAFNDGDEDCDCYLQGIEDIQAHIKSLIGKNNHE